MEKQQIYDLLDSQLDYNQALSLFYLEDDKTPLKLSRKTIDFLIEHQFEMSVFYAQLVEDEQVEEFVMTIATKVIQKFIRANQFLHFSQPDYENLATIYQQLIFKIVKLGKGSKTKLEKWMNQHYQDLKSFLIQTNHYHIFENYQQEKNIPYVACSEYSSSLQWKILHLNPTTIVSPILDIGCGTQAHFVLDCQQRNLEAYGFDRSIEDEGQFVFQGDWLMFDYGTQKWGTILSHMAFSNHFAHHHFKKDGNYRDYARVYLRILESLQKGGTFVYSPDLPFMEGLLDKEIYQIDKYQITDTIWTTHIKKKT